MAGNLDGITSLNFKSRVLTLQIVCARRWMGGGSGEGEELRAYFKIRTWDLYVNTKYYGCEVDCLITFFDVAVVSSRIN